MSYRNNEEGNGYEIYPTDKSDPARVSVWNRRSLIRKGLAKEFFTRHQSTSLCIVDSNRDYVLRSPPFGHDKDRSGLLVGVMFKADLCHIQRVMEYDGGTISRPYDGRSADAVHRFLQSKKDTYYPSIEKLADSFNGQVHLQSHTEIMAALRFMPNYGGGDNFAITVFSDNLESRLLAQLRQRSWVALAKKKYPSLKPSDIPIVTYDKCSLQNYTTDMQTRDRNLTSLVLNNKYLRHYSAAIKWIEGTSCTLGDIPTETDLRVKFLDLLRRTDPQKWIEALKIIGPGDTCLVGFLNKDDKNLEWLLKELDEEDDLEDIFNIITFGGNKGGMGFVTLIQKLHAMPNLSKERCLKIENYFSRTRINYSKLDIIKINLNDGGQEVSSLTEGLLENISVQELKDLIICNDISIVDFFIQDDKNLEWVLNKLDEADDLADIFNRFNLVLGVYSRGGLGPEELLIRKLHAMPNLSKGRCLKIENYFSRTGINYSKLDIIKINLNDRSREVSSLTKGLLEDISVADLKNLLSNMNPEEILKILESLGSNWLSNQTSSKDRPEVLTEVLTYILRHISRDKFCNEAISSLYRTMIAPGADDKQKLVSTLDDLVLVLQSTDSPMVALRFLEEAGELSLLINSPNSLIEIFDKLEEPYIKSALIQTLGEQELKKLILSAKDLNSMLKLLSKQSQLKLLNILGHSHLQGLIKPGDGVVSGTNVYKDIADLILTLNSNKEASSSFGLETKFFGNMEDRSQLFKFLTSLGLAHFIDSEKGVKVKEKWESEAEFKNKNPSDLKKYQSILRLMLTKINFNHENFRCLPRPPLAFFQTAREKSVRKALESVGAALRAYN